MNKINLHNPSSTYPAVARPDGYLLETFPVETNLGPARRLIFLIPYSSEYSTVFHRLSELARASGREVLLLGVCKNTTHELSLRRELITFSALLQNASVTSKAKVEIGTDWVKAIQSNARVGDIVVCFAEDRTGLFHRPLNQILQSNLQYPVYILSDLLPENLPQPNQLSQILAWMGSLGILGLAFLLQIRIVLLPAAWVQTILLSLSVVAEIGLIAFWNSLID